MRALLATLGLAALILAGTTLLTERGKHSGTAPMHRGDGSALRPVRGSRLSDAQINRQDPPDPVRQRHEARIHDRRPLLNALPIILRGVTFDIGGLAADERTTIIRANAHGLGRRHARIAFRTLRRQTGDHLGDYRLEITP